MPVERVVIEHGKLTGVRVTGQTEAEMFDRVISTIPLPFVPKMIHYLPDAVLAQNSNLRPLDHGIVYVPFYLPAEHPTFAELDAAFINKVRLYIQRINPEVCNDDFIDMHASRYRYAQPICPPGFLQQLPPYQTDIAGLWVADTSYYYPQDRGISESIDFGRKLAREACQ